MKNGIKIILIILLAILAIGLAGVMVWGIVQQERGERMKILTIGNKTSKLLEEEYETNAIQEIEVRAESSRIEVVEGDLAKIRVTAYGIEDEPVEVKQVGNKLVIEKPPVFHLFIFCAWCDEKIIVEVPKGSIKDYDLETTSGAIRVSDLAEGNLNVKSNSGRIQVGNGIALVAHSTSGRITTGDFQKAEIQTTSGGIEVGNLKEGKLKSTSGSIHCGDLEKGNVKTTSGSMHIGNTSELTAQSSSGRIQVETAKELTAKTTSGSIAVEKVDGFCDLSSTSGSIKIGECSLNENSEISAKSGSVHLKKANAFYTDAKTTSGSMKINSNDRKAETELKVRTTSGSIRVLE